MVATGCSPQRTFWKIGKQEVTADFHGGRIVSDAGLLPLRQFEMRIGILQELADRLPDPRAQKCVTHFRAALLTQDVYQILAGFPDGNDAQTLRHDPLLQTLVGVSPDADRPLASGSTLNRFRYAYTRRECDRPIEERAVLLEQQTARNQRLLILNDYLVELFMRPRREPPASIILDIDATDDPTHGQQILSGFHGYYDQHQYFPLLVFEGHSGFPLAAWLRPGTVHASCGAVDVLRRIVTRLRTAWPQVLIIVRGDNGFALPALYDYCETEGLLYAFGYARNAVLENAIATAMSDLALYYRCYGHREGAVQRFAALDDYQADGWTRPRRILAKMEINSQGINRRFVVTNMSGDPQGLYHGFYVGRGNVPERPIGELKNQLGADRLSASSFRANAFKLLEHVIAYAIVVLHREATAAIPEVAHAEVSTLRQMLWKVGALVQTSVRRIWFHLSETWPHRDLWLRVQEALMDFADRCASLPTSQSSDLPPPLLLPM
jgi:hypothetical protein